MYWLGHEVLVERPRGWAFGAAILFIGLGLLMSMRLLDFRLFPTMIYPVCQEPRSYYKGRSDDIVDVEGDLADDFLRVFQERLQPAAVLHPSNPRRLYMRWGVPFDRRRLVNVTYASIDEVILHRYGFQTAMDVRRGRARLPSPEFHEFRSLPTCAAVREIALKGGKWAESGPPLNDAK